VAGAAPGPARRGGPRKRRGAARDHRRKARRARVLHCGSAPHLAQKQSTQPVSEAFEGEKLNVILGHSPKPSAQSAKGKEKEDTPKEPVKALLLELLHKKYGITEEDFVTAELQAVPAGPARFVGFDKALVGAYGQDDRICVFTALEALLEAAPTGRSMAVMFWDKEEIGSDGATGASSRFFQYCVEDLAQAWGQGLPASRVFLETRALSADVAGALDPDYQDVHEKQNAALLGYGPTFCKFTGSRGKYGASEADAEYFAALRGLYNSKGIPWQAAELGKVDHGGGGTVALFLAAYGMRVIDLARPSSPCTAPLSWPAARMSTPLPRPPGFSGSAGPRACRHGLAAR
jgi:aspartyl aminopeptidase